MEVLHPRCAGLDVHKDTVVAAVRLTESDGSVRREVESFATTTPGLVALSDWLERHDCPSVAMEATGIYWRPVRAGCSPPRAAPCSWPTPRT